MATEQLIYGETWFSHTNEGTVLIGSVCEQCGNHWFPKRKVCPNCMSDRLADTELSRIGEVYSFTKLHVTSKRFTPPLCIAYVDFPEGVRVCGQVEGDSVEIGTKVEVTYGQIRQEPDGSPVYSYKFKALAE
jgi:hypothetical protein